MTLAQANERRMPGSQDARLRGCVCESLTNRHGMGWIDLPYQVRPTCPLHGAKAKGVSDAK